MHFTTVAVVPFESVIKNDLIKGIKDKKELLLEHFAGSFRNILRFYDYNEEQAPYKVYYSEKEVKDILGRAKIDENNQEQVFEALKDYNCDLSAGKDEKGYYVMSNKNKEGIFDYWNVYDICMMETALKHKDWVEHAIFTPNCKMVKSDHFFLHVGESNQKDFEKWKKQFHDILNSYSKDSLLVFIDCHC